MGRQTRPHVPGAAHHIVSRTQGHLPLLVKAIRGPVAELIERGVASGGARLVAHSVMPNHLHVLMFQGNLPLGRVMQPIMRRIALLVHRYHRSEGHVFERRFRSRLCADQRHLRNSILYIHRNPLKEGLCENGAHYPWCSHGAFLGNSPCGHIAVEHGLRIIANDSTATLSELRTFYEHAFAEYCRFNDDDEFAWTTTSQIPTTISSRDIPRIDVVRLDVPRLIDIRDAAEAALRAIADDIDMELVRSNFRGRQYHDIRKQLIATLLQRGYRGCAIAQFLRISPASVSRVSSAMRWGTSLVDVVGIAT